MSNHSLVQARWSETNWHKQRCNGPPRNRRFWQGFYCPGYNARKSASQIHRKVKADRKRAEKNQRLVCYKLLWPQTKRHKQQWATSQLLLLAPSTMLERVHLKYTRNSSAIENSQWTHRQLQAPLTRNKPSQTTMGYLTASVKAFIVSKCYSWKTASQINRKISDIANRQWNHRMLQAPLARTMGYLTAAFTVP